MIDDKSGKLTVDMEPILKVVLVRRETGCEGKKSQGSAKRTAIPGSTDEKTDPERLFF